jgi:hypothetical protein
LHTDILNGLGALILFFFRFPYWVGGFLIGWDNAITESTLSLERLFSDDEHKIGQRAILQVNGLASPIWAYAALFGWLVYLAVLTALPWILKFTSPHSTRSPVSTNKKQ